jgi:hypothetical protein
MQAKTQTDTPSPKLALTPAKKHREQEVQRVIKNLEDEMQRLVDILVSKTNH